MSGVRPGRDWSKVAPTLLTSEGHPRTPDPHLLERLALLAQTVGTAHDLPAVFRALLQFVIMSTPSNGIFASLYDPVAQIRRPVYAWSEGMDLDVTSLPALPMTGSPHSRAVATGQIVVVDDLQSALADQPSVLVGAEIDPRVPQSAIAVPMVVLGRVVGAFEAQSKEPAAYRDEHIIVLRMAANLAAIAVENVQALEREYALRLEAEASESRFRALMQYSSDITAVTDGHIIVQYISPAVERILGYTPAEIVGTDGLERLHPNDIARAQTFFETLRHSPGVHPPVELRVRHRDSSWHTLEMSGNNLLHEPAVQGIVLNSRDVTERKRAEEQLAYDAFHDALTGLANRALFLDRLRQALERAVRAPGKHCAVLFLDLDRFKTVNDSLGHVVGDKLLLEVAHRLAQCVHPGDTVARFGGDEFAILLEDLNTTQAAMMVAEQIKAALQVPILLEGQEIVTSASFGIAFSNPGGTCADELLRDADIAMYSAKRRGQGRHAVADPTMHAAMMARLQMEAELRQAIEREEFVLHYQPKMAMDGRTMQGVEALIRWQHPVRGFVSPVDFIPLAEETGLIVPIGTWVLRAACRQLQTWLGAGLAPFSVAVNLSVQQLKQRDIAATIRGILAETRLDPRLLELELTESILMEDAEATVASLYELRSIGVRALAVDDFGTGYSSLSYLLRFPVTEVKIDRSFVQDITRNPGTATLVMSIIGLAHSLGLDVTAEGVETEEQRVLLERAACDRFQGFLISRPLPADQLETFLQTHNDESRVRTPR
jgi:diguanylate cyclase (GGDEF)-like protein/PAS domain S-box-containing protein